VEGQLLLLELPSLWTRHGLVGVLEGYAGASYILEEGGIRVLPYLDNFFFSKKGKHACLQLCRRVREDFFDAELIINEPKCNLDPDLCLRKYGFDVDMGEAIFESRLTVGRPYIPKLTRYSQPEGEGCKLESSRA
jgi:hypothetical protein